MSLGTKLMQAVQKEAAMRRPFPLQAHATEAALKGVEVHASTQVADHDRFSHMANELVVTVERAVSSHSHPPASHSHSVARAPDPAARALKFTERATYLTERLKLVETDAGGTAIVRSTPETMAGPRAPYYEAKVRDDSIELKRYKPNIGQPGRHAIPFCLTDETLSRVVDDAANALGVGKPNTKP